MRLPKSVQLKQGVCWLRYAGGSPRIGSISTKSPLHTLRYAYLIYIMTVYPGRSRRERHVTERKAYEG